MTRAEAYEDGFAVGCRWAEEALRDGLGTADSEHELLSEARNARNWTNPAVPISRLRPFMLGRARGFRDTVARFEAGTLTWEMFDLGPVPR